MKALTDEDATQIAETLGDLPLAIDQAGPWLGATGMAAAEYIEQLTDQFPAIMELSQARRRLGDVAAAASSP